MQPFKTVAEDDLFGQWDQSAVWFPFNCVLDILLFTYFPFTLHMAASEMWCWSEGRDRVAELSFCIVNYCKVYFCIINAVRQHEQF